MRIVKASGKDVTAVCSLFKRIYSDYVRVAQIIAGTQVMFPFLIALGVDLKQPRPSANIGTKNIPLVACSPDDTNYLDAKR